jgi:AraC family ethanolamine operon transcriptional activator
MTQLQVTKLRVQTIDDLRCVLDAADSLSVPLSSSAPKGTILHASIGDILLSVGKWDADIRTRGGIHADGISLGMKLDSVSTHFSFRSASKVLPGDLYALARGDVVDYRVTGPIRYAFISLTPELLIKHGGEDAQRGDVAFWERCRWSRAPQAIRALIVRSVESFVAQVSRPDCALSGGALRQFQCELIEPFLWGFMFDERQSRERHALSGGAIVRTVEDWVDGQSPETVQISDLCRALRLSRRTLQRAFTETLGMGPARYLTIRRLTAVRKALQRGDPAATTVTDTASKYGFWELGRFAKDYRRMFGERPSETLTRGMR